MEEEHEVPPDDTDEEQGPEEAADEIPGYLVKASLVEQEAPLASSYPPQRYPSLTEVVEVGPMPEPVPRRKSGLIAVSKTTGGALFCLAIVLIVAASITGTRTVRRRIISARLSASPTVMPVTHRRQQHPRLLLLRPLLLQCLLL